MSSGVALASTEARFLPFLDGAAGGGGSRQKSRGVFPRVSLMAIASEGPNLPDGSSGIAERAPGASTSRLETSRCDPLGVTRAAAVLLNERLRKVLAATNRSLRKRQQQRRHARGHAGALAGHGASAAAAAAAAAAGAPLQQLQLVDTFALTDGRCWANLEGDVVHFS